jgi:hypothetical protein
MIAIATEGQIRSQPFKPGNFVKMGGVAACVDSPSTAGCPDDGPAATVQQVRLEWWGGALRLRQFQEPVDERQKNSVSD